MSAWRIQEGPAGLRLASVTRRQFGSKEMTWADLLELRLRPVRVYVLYFPSRFDLDFDEQVKEALRSFGSLTSTDTSVSFWDSTDPEYEHGMALFGLKTPPALVFATGLSDVRQSPLDSANVYSILITDDVVLRDRALLAAAANTAHEVLVRGDRAEIVRYLRARAAGGVLAAIGGLAGDLRDSLLKLKPKLGLPGGFSIQLG
jgi:hypothetical protein